MTDDRVDPEARTREGAGAGRDARQRGCDGAGEERATKSKTADTILIDATNTQPHIHHPACAHIIISSLVIEWTPAVP